MEQSNRTEHKARHHECHSLLRCWGAAENARGAAPPSVQDEVVPELNHTPCQQDMGLGGSRNKVICIFNLVIL